MNMTRHVRCPTLLSVDTRDKAVSTPLCASLMVQEVQLSQLRVHMSM